MLQAVTIDPMNDPRWLGFLQHSDDATVFHHPNWLRAIEATYNYQPMHVGFFEGNTLVGLLPLMMLRSWLTGRRGVCLPFSDFCYPLGSAEGFDESVHQLCREITNRERLQYIEIRGRRCHRAFAPSAAYRSHRIELDSDCDRVYRTFRRSHAQHVHRAQASGVRLEWRQDDNAMAEFIRLNAMTRKKLGVPPPPESFFWNIQRYLVDHNVGHLVLARFDDRTIAASLFLTFKECVMYKYSASDERFLRCSPNHLIVWEEVRWACERGYQLFDFGRSDVGNDGLINYKRGWGAREDNLMYCRLHGNNPKKSDRSRTVLEKLQPLMKKTPIPVLQLMGKLFYAHAE